MTSHVAWGIYNSIGNERGFRFLIRCFKKVVKTLTEIQGAKLLHKVMET